MYMFNFYLWYNQCYNRPVEVPIVALIKIKEYHFASNSFDETLIISSQQLFMITTMFTQVRIKANCKSLSHTFSII